MNRYQRKLSELIENGKEISVAVVGAGFMGRSLAAQLLSMKGIRPRIIVDRQLEKAKKAYTKNKVHEELIQIFQRKNPGNGYYISDSLADAFDNDFIDVVVDTTGNANAGAYLSQGAVRTHKHIVSFNVETDAAVGVALSRLAEREGVVYTGIYGDEPGSIKELYDFADLLGFEVLVVGKGKNNPLDLTANPDSVREKALASKLKPEMLTSFVDATNTMIELASIGNAIGFVPDVPGCHGITSEVKELPDLLCLKKDGGILHQYRTLEYVFGIAPGVFAIVRAENMDMDYEMRFLKMGKGPNYVLYRPYHLTSIEAPISILKAYFDREVSIAPLTMSNEVSARAKRNIQAGEMLDGIGGYSCYGTLERFETARAEHHIPISLIDGLAVAKTNIRRGEFFTERNVALNTDSEIYKLRKIQDEMMSSNTERGRGTCCQRESETR